MADGRVSPTFEQLEIDRGDRLRSRRVLHGQPLRRRLEEVGQGAPDAGIELGRAPLLTALGDLAGGEEELGTRPGATAASV